MSSKKSMKSSNRSTSAKVRRQRKFQIVGATKAKARSPCLDLIRKGILSLCCEKDRKEREGVSVMRFSKARRLIKMKGFKSKRSSNNATTLILYLIF